MAPRVLPHRPEAEGAVLGGILLRGVEAFAEVRDVLVRGADEFYVPKHQAVWVACEAIAARGEPIDVIQLETQLRRTQQLELVGGIEGIARLDRYSTAHNIAKHAQLVREAAVQRDLVVYHRETAELFWGEIDDLQGEVAKSQAEHAEIAIRAHGGDGLVSMRDALEQGVRELVDRSKGIGACTPFGFRRIDREYGGMLPSELWILAARTGHGKSAAAWAIARNQVLRGVYGKRGRWQARPDAPSVLYSSNEMTPVSLSMRGLSEAIMVDGAAFRRPTEAWVDANRAVIKSGLGMLGFVPITFGWRPRYDIDQACADARLWYRREVRAGRTPTLAIFDYLQNYDVPRWLQKADRKEQISYISGRLKSIANELKIPVLALMQLNRNTEGRTDGKPQIIDLRESGKPEMDADGIGLMWRPERNHPDRDARKQRLLALSAKISQPGVNLTDAERTEYEQLYHAKLLAKITFPKVRGAEADWVFDLEFLPEFTRLLDQLETETDHA
jgi:replicative DNA helicase